MTATLTAPSLREVILDALNDAYWSRRANVEECRSCTRNPCGVCPEHEEDNTLAQEYEEARKRLQNAPGDLDVLAAAAEAGQREGETT